MLNPFPSLLVFGFFAPTLLRIAAAVFFAYSGYLHMRDRKAMGARLGTSGGTIISVISAIYLLTAAGLFVGYYTQIAALVGSLIAAIHLVAARRWPMHHDLGRSSYALLLVVCLSLLISGAGALAFDLPL